MNKYLLISTACVGWAISLSAGAQNSPNQAELLTLENLQISTVALEAEPEKLNSPAATVKSTTAAAKGKNDTSYVTPLRDYNNNGVFGN